MLPGIGFSEIIVLGLAALIFIGPKDLPMLMRKLGQIIGKGRRMASEFQAAFDDIARQSELDELKKEIEALKRSNMMTQAAEDLAAVEADINSAVMRETAEPAPGPDALPPAAEDKTP
ncbi:MAG: twin-arginine translocase subunit TatB [Hyphomonas sp.]|jgi:sec-independent protein translocase protein TatB|uniref:Sec-independent protein translocase protein TatB n=1 Tax=Hyphomonas sp. TaxID=87 RepID=UPI0017FC6D5D|nr:Sec-independent protein translocase protein TatB [Hyphomonas sp.]MBA3069816.1 twin-arginine translocase subunit TatB [Hyphomonas sp.]MBU3919448.1 Sec-independent protein translocase protein TatB [Alphaproteobacteria bacterium]MBU4062657.1 Sec-independent protein translocase protein TatB [Alphaproteobacteria bacterium]MBU4164008.1 Sec-independent protein translocase protein TatB [Alphaproteobacteria bacterium]